VDAAVCIDAAHFKRRCFRLLMYVLSTTDKENLIMQTAKYGNMLFEISSFWPPQFKPCTFRVQKQKNEILDPEYKAK
jgi:hypothetical protein